MPVVIMGVLNVTPDSFSDGGNFFCKEDALAQARKMVAEGAAIIDVGADSTRPGAEVCVGPEKEWERLAPVVTHLSDIAPWSIDTHHPQTARKAVQSGASIINDVSGGSEQMMEVAAENGCKLVCMYSRAIGDPHQLLQSPNPQSSIDLFQKIKSFFEEVLTRAHKVGLNRSQIIFDPGMGSFISDKPEDSFFVLNHVAELSSFGNLLVGVSRKGFLKSVNALSFDERDWVGGAVAALSLQKIKNENTVYLRTHNVKVQQLIMRMISA